MQTPPGKAASHNDREPQVTGHWVARAAAAAARNHIPRPGKTHARVTTTPVGWRCSVAGAAQRLWLEGSLTPSRDPIVARMFRSHPELSHYQIVSALQDNSPGFRPHQLAYSAAKGLSSPGSTTAIGCQSDPSSRVTVKSPAENTMCSPGPGFHPSRE